MIFSTTIFVFLFLPLFLAGYYLLPFRYRSGWILLGSWAFYAWWRLDFLSLIVATTIWTYALGAVVARERLARPSRARAALALGCVLNLGILAYFKYFNFTSVIGPSINNNSIYRTSRNIIHCKINNSGLWR